MQILPGARCEVGADLDQRDDLPVVRQRRVERAERIGDASPLLDRRIALVASVDRVPYESANDAEAQVCYRIRGWVFRVTCCVLRTKELSS